MKTKKVVDEGIGQTWKNIKSAAKDAAIDFTGTPQQVARKNFINNFATQMLDALETAIEGGFVQPAPSVVESVKTLKTKYDRLNYILESLIQEAPTPISIRQWVMEYLTRTTIGGSTYLDIFKYVPGSEEDFKEMANELESVYPKRSAVLNVLKKMGLKALVYMDKARAEKELAKQKQQAGTQGTTTSPASTTTQSTQANPQEKYTKAIVSQIEQMTPEYKDDIPVIINVMLDRLGRIDPNIYQQVMTNLKSRPSTYSSYEVRQDMREGMNPNVRPRVKPKALKKLDDAIGGVATSTKVTRKY